MDSRFVLVNPFNHNSRFSLPESAWLDLIEELLARDYPVLLITYPSVHKTFMHALIARGLARKIFVFANDTNLGNLIAMVGKAHYCISPSTGTIHLALNLGLKCIGLYPSYDQGRWGSEQLTYITLTTPRNELDSSACATLIAQTMETLKSLES